jgi:hypothetical protein
LPLILTLKNKEMAKAKTEPTSVPNPEEMSQEALNSKRKEISEYYQENIPHLKTQLEYEELLRDIEKTRAERLQAQMWIAQTMAPSPEGEEEGVSKPLAAMNGEQAAEEIKRTLKRAVNEKV